MRLLVFILTVVLFNQSYALVDMKSANYTNTWVDMEVPGTGYDLKIIRTYNSRSLFSGIFGFGWCSNFETTIEATAEGNIKLKECGSGQEVYYYPRQLEKTDISKTIDGIVTKMKSDKKANLNSKSIDELKEKLFEDSELRTEYASKYNVALEVKDGASYYANGQEVENISVNKKQGYYNRNMADGSVQRFNMDGKLTHFYDKNGNYVKFSYNGNQLVQIEDNNIRRLNFKYYPSKKVKSITGPNGIKADYKFSDIENLTYVNNAWGNPFTYKYDDLHNLTQATWPDKTSIEIKYNTKKDWVVAFKDRDKCNESYNYEFSSKDPDNHYWVTAKKVCGKETVADNRYEFWHKQRSDGQYFLQRVLTDINNVTTDISYHEKFFKPVSIRRNSERITFEYFPDGQVKTKSTDRAELTYEYDKELKKVSKVTTKFLNEKGKIAETKVAAFKYDKKGNLYYAENSDGQKIKMSYDNKGRIDEIIDHTKKLVKIKYDEKLGKPAIVTRPGLGTIKITYKGNGEINKVDSPEGPSVALQIASTFNNLLDVIAPATAELYM